MLFFAGRTSLAFIFSKSNNLYFLSNSNGKSGGRLKKVQAIFFRAIYRQKMLF
jgi:hypothetical protein